MQPGGSDLLTQGDRGKIQQTGKEQLMKKSTGITRMARHLLAVILTVSLVCGLAGLEDGAYAASGTSPFANTRSSYNHNARFNGNLIVHGVDVSYFQATGSDWKAAKLNGCDYAIMRVTYTTYGNGSLNIDSKFATHYSKANAAGVMKGVYVFSQAKSAAEARKEAQYAVNRLRALGIGPEDLELPVYMDYEFAGKSSGKNKGRLYGLKQKTAIEAVNAFADVIRTNGYDPGVYANTNFFKSYLANGTGLASDIDMWCAQYYNMNQSPSNYTKWQYSSTARVNGILYYSTNKIGSTDVDFWYLNKNANSAAKTTIYGNTNLNYTGNAVKPVLEIYNGGTLLKEGTDYIVGGINNVKKSSSGAYAYVKGIGKYGGYALVPVTIDSGYINHIGLSKVGGVIFANKSGSSYSIGSNSNGAYVRNVPAGTTAGTLLSKIALKSSYSGKYTLKVIDARGSNVADGTRVSTGMMVGVYSGSTLKGTADITVNGSAINNTGANYLRTVNRSIVTVPTVSQQISNVLSGKSTNGALVVDGKGGKATIKELQKFLGVKQTGKITIKKKYKKYSTGVTSKKYANKKDPTVKAMQRWLGVKADGVWGKGTSKALQRKLGVKADGKFGKNSMKALQRYLNSR